jgi:hypothetical protein
MDTYFIFNDATKFTTAIDNGTLPPHMLYGAWHLQKTGQAKIIDYKESKKIKNAQVIINVPKYAPELKARGNKVILINLNSNHILERNPGRIMTWILKNIYNACDTIICLDKDQEKKLKQFGTTAKLITNPLYIDTDDLYLAQIRKFGTYGEFYLSTGFDAGRNFTFAAEINSYLPIVTLGRHCPVSYTRYCDFLVRSNGMVLNITNAAASSDLSGSTTVFEALCAKKPVFINPQPWLKNFPNKNIYVYKNLQELEMLLNLRPKWKEDAHNYEFVQFINKLKKVLNIR